MSRFVKYQGTSRKSRLSEALVPSYFRFDERSTADFLKYINRLATCFEYVDSSNNPSGDWSGFFLSDESFLLAEMAGFDVSLLDRRRIALIQSFDAFAGLEEKAQYFTEVFQLTLSIFQQVNEWYRVATAYSRNKESTSTEVELASAIEYNLRGYLRRLIAFDIGRVNSELPIVMNNTYAEFLPLWNLQDIVAEDIYTRGDTESVQIHNALKQLLLVFRPAFHVLNRLVVRAPVLLEVSLEQNDKHPPHIGLLLSFLKLYTYLQEDLNDLTRRHLDFYFKTVLGQQPKRPGPDRMFFVAEIAPAFQAIRIPVGQLLKAGQNKQGQDILYATDREITLSQIRIAELKTVFVSRNPIIDQYSQFRMVSGVYASPVANSRDGLGEPLADPSHGWPALGEEQRFLSEAQRTMPEARLGFAIASPVFKTAGGKRRFELAFHLTSDSIQYLTTLLIDIANVRQVRPEDVFIDVFSRSFSMEITTASGWLHIPEYTILPPTDWASDPIILYMELDPSQPAVVSYTEAVHQGGLHASRPVLRVFLNSADVNHPYSFLENLHLVELGIRVHVEQLRNSSLFNHFGPLNANSPFDLLGPIPKRGSYFLIGQEELFSKRIDQLDISWDYLPFPFEQGGLKEHYSGYNRGIQNESFQLAISALTQFKFRPEHKSEVQRVPLFESESDGSVRTNRSLIQIELDRLHILPKYDLDSSSVAAFDPGKETGFLKFELVEPAMGFGFDVFPGLFVKAATENARPAGFGREPKRIELPKNPVAPQALNVSLNYSAHTALVFDQRRAYENEVEAEEAFFHIHPFGVSPVFFEGRASETTIIPAYKAEGALYIGFEQATPPQDIHVLFELKRSEKREFGQNPQVTWHYLTGNSWKPFLPEQILEDGTRGLMVTGIISMRLPMDINAIHDVLPSGKYWIRASVQHKAHLISRVVRVYPNAGSALYQFRDAKDPGNPIPLPAQALQNFVNPIPGVTRIIQPLPAFGYQAGEDDLELYTRVSERLRHKNRCITRWDYERMLLNQFDFIAQVKCITPSGNEEFVPRGALKIVAMPKVQDATAFYPPELSPGDILAMESFLREHSSPFVRIEVRNPSFEQVRIKCKVRFQTETVGLAIKELHLDILRFICPWFFSEDMPAALGGSIKKSELFNFIQSRPYVGFVTGLSVIHLQIDDAGLVVMRDSALQDGEENDLIEGGTPWSVLIPSSAHDIELLDTDRYYAPEPTTLSDLKIGVNLVISGDSESSTPPPPNATRRATDDTAPRRFTLKF